MNPQHLIAIPLDEYLALQRLVGFAQSITGEKFVTHYKDAPYDECLWHHPVTSAWRESLKAHADRAERAAMKAELATKGQSV